MARHTPVCLLEGSDDLDPDAVAQVGVGGDVTFIPPWLYMESGEWNTRGGGGGDAQ
jgi:hypothetical protein